ncbi:hypothetical protein [uncultured Megamonas sp.]|uniref:hypothetical protein n=1 Tax=uncultured Megamonas sp. TaxID=286140 RepID=UPI0025F38CE7|nr:hypothetical protein [uncultured Megamonas sp.]
MKKYLSSVLIMMCILLSAVVASAEKAEWKADNYNINKVQKIYVEDVVEKGDNVSFSELEDLKIRQSLDENEKYIKKYRIVNNKDIADAVLSVKMLTWGTNKRWVDEEKVTENQTITHTGKDGKTSSVTIPVTVTKPGYYYYTQYFSAKFVLTDKDGNTIFERIDKREDEKNAYDMFNRAVKDFYKDVNSLK